MNRSLKAGTALRLLCLPLFAGTLAACERQVQVQPQAHVQASKPNEAEEVFSLVEATKNNPSLKAGSNEAGAPIQVNLHPKPAAPHDEHDHHDMAKH